MKALVVYDSQFGNTQQVAEAIARDLELQGEVELLHVSQATPPQLAACDLLVVGSPTQGFRPTSTVNRLLKAVPKGALQGIRVAAFDTRFTKEEIEAAPAILAPLVGLFGYAARPIADRLEAKGGQLAAAPEGFYVTGTEGPLLDGELERAAAWANQLTAGD